MQRGQQLGSGHDLREAAYETLADLLAPVGVCVGQGFDVGVDRGEREQEQRVGWVAEEAGVVVFEILWGGGEVIYALRLVGSEEEWG